MDYSNYYGNENNDNGSIRNDAENEIIPENKPVQDEQPVIRDNPTTELNNERRSGYSYYNSDNSYGYNNNANNCGIRNETVRYNNNQNYGNYNNNNYYGNASHGNASYGNANYGNASYGNANYGNANNYYSNGYNYGYSQNNNSQYNQTKNENRYNSYYGNENDDEIFSNGKQNKGGSFGSYVVTAIIFTLIGAMLMYLIYPIAGFNRTNPFDSYELPSNTQTPAPDITNDPTSTDEPQATEPQRTQRPMTQYDGKVPVISDSTNPIPDIVDGVTEGIVGVINYTDSMSRYYGEDVAQGTGTGFIISSEGYIATNAHVIDGASKVSVLMSDGEEVAAEIVGFDLTTDVAVLKIEKAGLKPLALGNSDNIRVGEFIVAIGDPTGRELAGTTTFGIISAKSRDVNINGRVNTYIQIDAAINPGNSGGPLINMNGEVIGITSAKTVTASYDEYGNAISAEGLGFAIPINDALKIVEMIITKGYVERPGIGISVVTITDAFKYLNPGVPEGVVVYSVTKNGPGHKAGLQVDDIITECDGKKIEDNDTFISMIRAKGVGGKVTVKVWRNGEVIDVTITIGDLNSIGSELVEAESKFKWR